MQNFKKEMYTLIDKINKNVKEEYKDLNDKLLTLRNDLTKTIDTKNSFLENKIKNFGDKIELVERGNKSLIELNKSAQLKMREIDAKIKNNENKLKQIDNQLNLKKKILSLILVEI